MDKDQIYKDFGGDGPAMDGDDFVKRAVAMYDGIESVGVGAACGAACGEGEGERKEQVDEKKSTSSSSVAVEIKDVAGKDGFKILDV